MNVVYMYFDYMVLWMIHNLHDHISYQVNKDYSDDIEQRPWHECQCNVGSILGLVTSSILLTSAADNLGELRVKTLRSDEMIARVSKCHIMITFTTCGEP